MLRYSLACARPWLQSQHNQKPKPYTRFHLCACTQEKSPTLFTVMTADPRGGRSGGFPLLPSGELAFCFFCLLLLREAVSLPSRQPLQKCAALKSYLHTPGLRVRLVCMLKAHPLRRVWRGLKPATTLQSNCVLLIFSAMSSMIRNQEKRIQKVKDQEKMLLK